jgi:hypothetical protein
MAPVKERAPMDECANDPGKGGLEVASFAAGGEAAPQRPAAVASGCGFSLGQLLQCDWRAADCHPAENLTSHLPAGR